MDIRSFFAGASGKKKKTTSVAQPATAPVSKKREVSSRPKHRAKRQISDDEDDFLPSARSSAQSKVAEQVINLSDDDDDDEEALALAILGGGVSDDEEVSTSNKKAKIDIDLSKFSATKRSDSPEKHPFTTHGTSPQRVRRSSASPQKNKPASQKRLLSPKKEVVQPSPVKKEIVHREQKPEKKSTDQNASKDGSDEKEDTPAKKPGAKWGPRNPHYRQMMAREPPKGLGSKEIPEGKPNCLSGVKICVTGILESIEREQAEELVQRYGGSVAKSITKKLSYAVVGRDAGPKKLELIDKYGIKTLDEDGFFDLIRSRPAGVDEYAQMVEQAMKEKAEQQARQEAKHRNAMRARDVEDAAMRAKKARVDDQTTPAVTMVRSRASGASHRSGGSSAEWTGNTPMDTASGPHNGTPGTNHDDPNASLWSVKYAPTNVSKIVGQNGPKSNMNKLKNWLQDWYKNKERRATEPMPRKPSDTGWEFSTCVMAGPPGVGKTTTAHLVCQELGFEIVEMNASDCRSKKNLKTYVATLLGNTTMVQFYKKTDKGKVCKQALVMDEVDGMGGSADMGGMGELISLIKTTKIPIICMANDKDSQKMRNLKKHVFWNNFHKLQMQKCKGLVMQVLFKEGVKVDPGVVEQVIEGTNCDMRQILNNLQMWSRSQKKFTYDQIKQDVQSTVKDTKENPFQYSGRFFRPDFHRKPLEDRIRTYFNDYSMTPLFVQESYLAAAGSCQKGPPHTRSQLECLNAMSQASDAIAEGDVIGNHIFSGQNFGLLPLHAVVSCIMPGYSLQHNGGVSGMMMFPQALGRTSTMNKNARVLTELNLHMRDVTSSDNQDLRLNYLPYLRKRLVKPLTEGTTGVEEVIALLDTYHLTREDWDSINDLCQLKSMASLTAGIDSKVKASFTREYNRGAHALPYSTDTKGSKQKKGRAASTSEDGSGDPDVEGLFANDDDNDDDDVPQAKNAKKGSSVKPKAKGKGKGKGKKRA
eukprot:m.329595 g.329595  ORF g.329595 m.329595 type:complete len:984 (+) comp20449_c0_seq2:60-3011(+)